MTADNAGFPDLGNSLNTALGVPAWTERIVAAGPYADADAVCGAVWATMHTVGEAELAEALSHHPRIGASVTGSDSRSNLSRSEQFGVHASAERALIRAGNIEYERVFGRIFLVRAAERTPAEILAELNRRLLLDDAAEHREVLHALADIGTRRLRVLLAEW
ncbi:OHCU decarboxylase [Mycetocola tolaasinivorans]|uniref:2-oxo-4-hydroxy-4-carboxy-5-ureidoimidazoline decarboxylase n=1 Tax=Mycetocola tolaasinivorans TaxID=76635 RepID=A0A3L7ABF8_9MICO|nr:2-oxo-4-hydroxy-4-carboxy-5-ureidoimidazoline decarboxylase [Mycetocola tolaasinivorans]RLP77304.1 OHCU decarboxylase [Mycetocola tolaasinivorans]